MSPATIASPISRPSCLIVSTATGSFDGTGASPPLPIAAAPRMLRLAHHTKAENNNNATNHWLKTLFFILLPPVRLCAGYCDIRSIREVKNVVHDLRGHGRTMCAPDLFASLGCWLGLEHFCCISCQTRPLDAEPRRLCFLVGSVLSRYDWIWAGVSSAKDPEALFQIQRKPRCSAVQTVVIF